MQTSNTKYNSFFSASLWRHVLLCDKRIVRKRSRRRPLPVVLLTLKLHFIAHERMSLSPDNAWDKRS